MAQKVQHQESPLPPPPGVDTEAGGAARPESNFRGLSNVGKWKKEDWMKKGLLVLFLRAFALLFSFLSFMIMVTLTDFNQVDGYSYVLSIAIFTMVYTAVQVGIKGHEVRTGVEVIPPTAAIWIDFIGDQIIAYLLLSSASVAATYVSEARKAFVGQWVDQASAAITMSFFAFFTMATASLISGYHLSTLLSS